MSGRFGFDQLSSHAHVIPRPPYAALQHVAHTQVAADGFHVNRLSLVDESRIAGYHDQPFDARKPGDDLLYDTVGEVILFGISAEVVERQHSDRGPLRRYVWLWRLCSSGLAVLERAPQTAQLVRHVQRSLEPLASVLLETSAHDA